MDTQELPPVISLNMAVCLSNQDLNQPDRWLLSSLQAISQVSKADMVDHLLNLLANILISRWDMEDLLALVVTAEERSRPQMLSGVPQPPKALETASVDTKDKHNAHFTTCRKSISNRFACRIGVVSGKTGYQPRGLVFFISASVLVVLWWLVSPSARPFSMEFA